MKKIISFLQCVFLYIIAVVALFLPLYAIFSIPVLIIHKMGTNLHMVKYAFPGIIAFLVSNGFWLKRIFKPYFEEKKCLQRRSQIVHKTNGIVFQVYQKN